MKKQLIMLINIYLYIPAIVGVLVWYPVFFLTGDKGPVTSFPPLARLAIFTFFTIIHAAPSGLVFLILTFRHKVVSGQLFFAITYALITAVVSRFTLKGNISYLPYLSMFGLILPAYFIWKILLKKESFKVDSEKTKQV